MDARMMAEIDSMMSQAASRDLAEPWQAVQAALVQFDDGARTAVYADLHRALVAQGHDPNDRAYV